MTPEQITMLLQILQNTPLTVLLMVAIYVAYRDIRGILLKRLEWLSEQLTAYMQRDREIVTETLKERVLTASKWQPMNSNGIPPAPG